MRQARSSGWRAASLLLLFGLIAFSLLGHMGIMTLYLNLLGFSPNLAAQFQAIWQVGGKWAGRVGGRRAVGGWQVSGRPVHVARRWQAGGECVAGRRRVGGRRAVGGWQVSGR